MSRIIRVNDAGLTEGELARVQAVLEDGDPIAFPTETVYGLGVLPSVDHAARRLNVLKGRPSDHPLTLHLAPSVDVELRVGVLSPLARRLAGRFWPGPLTQILPVSGNGSVGIRYPRHAVLERILEATGGSLLGTSANVSGQPPATTVEGIPTTLAEAVALIIDDGPCRHATASTVVRPVGDYPEVLREGAIARSLVLDECGPTTLIVCSGNTCRSPMGRVLLQGLLKDRVESERQKRGLPLPAVGSAGMAAMDGFPASHFAVQAVSGPGSSLADHVSRRITPILIREADFILVVSDAIASSVLQQVPDAAHRITVLNAAGGGIPDPFGGSLEDYQRCADALRNELAAFLDQHHARFLGETGG